MLSSLFYHSIVLSLNRHFLPGAHQFAVHQPSESACAASCEHVLAMLRHFRQEHGSDETSLMMIYAVVLTAVILATSSCKLPSNRLSDHHGIEAHWVSAIEYSLSSWRPIPCILYESSTRCIGDLQARQGSSFAAYAQAALEKYSDEQRHERWARETGKHTANAVA